MGVRLDGTAAHRAGSESSRSDLRRTCTNRLWMRLPPTQCMNSMALESQFHHKIVNLLYSKLYNKLTIVWGVDVLKPHRAGSESSRSDLRRT